MGRSRSPLKRKDPEKFILKSSRSRSRSVRAKPTQLSRRPSKNDLQDVFQPRSSLLDADSTDCDLRPSCSKDEIIAFNGDIGEHFGRRIQGWVNLFWLVTAYWVALTWYGHYKRCGSWFGDERWLLLRLAYDEWTLFGLLEAGLFALSFGSVLLQQAIIKGYLAPSGFAYYILRHAYQAAFIILPVLVSNKRKWPAMQIGTVVAHGIVYYMKVHAYLSTNRRLHLAQGDKQSNYPANVGVKNFCDYLLFPTLLYETHYPRTARIRWSFVADRTAGLLAVLSLIYATIESSILPVLRSHPFTTLEEKIDCLTHLMLPICWSMLLLFFFVFEYLLNWFAEITRFADRHFYDDWWNSLTFAEFARKWNVPVHAFLQRHIYLPCLEEAGMSRFWASFMTFFLSSILHELVMSSMLMGRPEAKWPRCTFFCMQMLQIPVIWLSARLKLSRFPKLANLFFWFSIVLGLSIFTLHYSH